MHAGIGIGLHNLCHLIINLVLWFFYHFEFEMIERYKSNDLPWPWKEDREAWKTLCLKSIAVLCFNGNIMVILTLSAMEYLGIADHHTMAIEDLPDTKTFILSITFFMLVEDFGFYLSHRLLHWKYIYPHIHKMHHTHKITVGIAGEYAHPLEYMLGNMLPTSVGPAVLGFNKCHLVTVIAWYIIRFTENLDGHSGYEFSWSPYRLIPFSGSAEYHAFHHAVNIGNYGSFFSIWDTIFGTNRVFNEAQDKVNNAKVKSN